MPTVAICQSCGKKLRIPDGMTAAKARCPGCGAIIALTKTGITAQSPVSPPKKDDKPRPKPSSEGIVPEVPADEAPRPRKKKRKRRSEAKSSSGVPLWIWGAFAGTILLLAGIVSAAFIHSGHADLLLGFVLGMAILLPVSVVILVISMFIASALLGGIDFGQAHVAIPKAGALLFVVTLLQMIPFVGWLLALLVWFLGLMKLFELDFAEARILVFINWGLNSLFRYFVLAIILSSMLHADTEDGPLKDLPPSDEDAAVKQLEAGMVLLNDKRNGRPWDEQTKPHPPAARTFLLSPETLAGRRLREGVD